MMDQDSVTAPAAPIVVADRVKRFGNHQNAFGALRLLFAAMVIFSHVPEIVDGDDRREIIHRLLPGATSGGLAVDGFFIISGYLITTSSLRSRSRAEYLKKRCLRIYPGFIAASLVSLLVLAPLAGGIAPASWAHAAAAAVFRMALLARPVVVGVFQGQHFPDPGSGLNGALWTIQYEALCYLLILPIVWVPARYRAWLTVGVSVLCFATGLYVDQMGVVLTPRQWLFPVTSGSAFNLVGTFFAAATYAVMPTPVRVSRPLALGAALALLVCLRSGYVPGGLAVALFGGYVIMAVGELGAGTLLARINNKVDLSYGTYLYAWPIERLLIQANYTSSLLVLDVSTLALSLAAGALSWTFVEKPALSLAKRRIRPASPSGRRVLGTQG